MKFGQKELLVKTWLRWWLSPFIRWLARGGLYSFASGRSEDAVWILYGDPFGDEYSVSMTPDEARETARDLMGMARDVQEGVPMESYDQGGE